MGREGSGLTEHLRHHGADMTRSVPRTRRFFGPDRPFGGAGTAVASWLDVPREPLPASEAIVEVTMGLLWFAFFGLIVGFLARAIMPGRQHMGLIMTSVLGMVGSLIGGFLGSLISSHDVARLHAAGMIGSIVGALLLLAIVGMGSRRRFSI
jgi:uncharacterized membrane protein YeaQ/YmgE (transglycosylase-associated protein family)